MFTLSSLYIFINHRWLWSDMGAPPHSAINSALYCKSPCYSWCLYLCHLFVLADTSQVYFPGVTSAVAKQLDAMDLHDCIWIQAILARVRGMFHLIISFTLGDSSRPHYYRVPMHTGNLEMSLNLTKSRNLPEKILPVKKSTWYKNMWISIVPQKKTSIVKEKSTGTQSWCSMLVKNLNKSGWIRQLEGVRRRLYYKNVDNQSDTE